MSGCLCIHWPGAAGSTVRNMSYNSRGDALTTVYGFLRGLLMYLQSEYNCISRETVSYTSRGTNHDIVSDYPRAHYNAGLNTSAAVCRRRCLIRQRRILASAAPATKRKCADGRVLAGGFQTRVCRRKCSDRRLPAASYFRSNTGIMSSGASQVIVSEPS